jgi:hypothetical protein
MNRPFTMNRPVACARRWIRTDPAGTDGQGAVGDGVHEVAVQPDGNGPPGVPYAAA